MLVAGVYKGKEAEKIKDREAQAYTEASLRRKAAMTREMSEDQRKKNYMESRLRSVAAKQGGGGLGTSGLTNLVSDLNAEGEYRIMATMYQGLDEAAGLDFRAEAARREGDAARTAGWINGITSAVSAYTGMGGDFGGQFSQSAQMKRGLAASSSSGASLPKYDFSGREIIYE